MTGASTTGAPPWPLPSPRIQELIRAGATRALNPPQEWRDELEAAIFAGPSGRQVSEDPDLLASARRTIVSNLYSWVIANVHAPGRPVPADVSDVPITIARDLVRRGIDESIVDAYRVGQNVAWRHWMETAFELTSDPDELREVLDVTARSIAAFVDATVEEVGARMAIERADLTRGVQAERREVIALILDGAPITEARAAARLGYPLGRTHHALVVWSDSPHPDVAALDRVSELLARPARGAAALSVTASTGTRWIWTTAAPDLVELDADMAAVLADAPDVRVAAAGPGTGLAGFRRAHLDAVATQRLLARVDSHRRTATFAEVALVCLAAEDDEAATRFVTTELGDLAVADADLRDALRLWIRHRCSVTAAAAASWTHRNTFLRRLKRAEALLPDGAMQRLVEVAVALDLVHWRGWRDPSAPRAPLDLRPGRPPAG